MHRRSFLQKMAISPVIATNFIAGTSILSLARKAYAASGKTLIVVFQRGGCDGLNTVIPYAEDEYYSLRPDISISPPGSGENSAIDLNGFFGLHPALAPLSEIYRQGNMAILPAVHFPNGSRSHFTCEDLIESGASNGQLEDGWLNRYLAGTSQNTQLRAASFGGLNHSMKGSVDVATIKDLSFFNDNEIDDSFISALDTIFQQPENNKVSKRNLLKKHGNILLENLELLKNIDHQNYAPSNGVMYPKSYFGLQMQQIAHLIKSGVGIEIFTANSIGWDDHANQGKHEGAQAERHADFSTSIAALYKDLGSTRMNDVVILTMTEFGRTAKQNASGGTDHGNASNWFVIGGGVHGDIYGDWPGLQPDDLYLGRYLRHTIDFRDIFAEVISNHLGNPSSLSTVLPNHTYRPIGFL